ncbi:hypothetical protein EIB75_08125 [Epilithonimonas vandammei]|uniref:Uncharacterized protein n=1 Tax=Epilithonimonas vandammei TaxID=2487072 RepID=A0A3G8ZCV0_9FLAO|nr:hypothetical protein [Epilithonimonas vandammei]AZI55212.1 hypothetical protein EIB75_08125 [Epilithonimonas vandammei]
MKRIIKFVIYGSLAFYIFLFSFIGTITDNNDARKISLALLIIVVGWFIFKEPLKRFLKKIFT